MQTKDELIQLINQLITPPAEAWKNDPFEVLIKTFPKNLIEKYVETHSEDSIPSTSEDVRTVNADARIQYSQVLGGLYLDLSTLLDAARNTCEDEHNLVSLQDMSALKKSFEFFLLTGILPFLEPGVGLGASSRSTFIKSWKLYDGNKEACSERLDFAAKVIISLLKCNNALIAKFLPKFIDDVLAVRYQLLELKIDKYEEHFKDLFQKCPADMLYGALMFLTQDKKTAKTPMWMKVACGKQMTKILIDKNGLSFLLQYYRERAGETWTDNLPMTKQVARHLATVPRMFKHPLKYHEIISNQFFELFWNQEVTDKNLLAVFINYVDELRVRFSLNADITVYDKILRFWEILDRKIQEKTTKHSEKIASFSSKHIKNLQLLTQLQSSTDIKRVRAIVNCLFACSEHVPPIKDILKIALDGVANIAYTLYQYVLTPSHSVSIEKNTSTSDKIQEIGSTDNGNNVAEPRELWLHGIEHADVGVAHRLETAFYVVDNVITQVRTRTILELIGMAYEDFVKVSEKEREDDQARFVKMDGAKLFSSAHVHLIVGCCFERLVNVAGDVGFTTEECVQLLRLCENLLNIATAKFIRLAHRKRNVDVFSLSADEKREFEATRDTAKMCIPMITTVYLVTQGTPRFHEVHLKAMESVANFTKAADGFPSDDYSFNAAIEEAKKMLRELKIDVNQVNPPPIPQRPVDRRRYSQVDICTEWIEELNDDEPAIKGGALMQIAKAFRNKSYVCQRLLDYAAFETVKELISDEDSYVFLSAINCLCEMALFERHIFDALIAYYEELVNLPDKNQKTAIRIGRIAEAIGKLFIARGDFSITYFDRMAANFIRGINESEEILRASSCGAFGNLLVATHGRGIEKWLDKLLHILHNLIQVDRSPLVRRSAVDLIRHSLKSAGSDIFVILRERLLDIHREVTKLYRTDRDETVRLHSQLCLEEIDAALRQNHEETERGYQRKIRF